MLRIALPRARSIVPMNKKAGDYGEGKIESVLDTDNLHKVADMMLEGGYSQIPVYSSTSNGFLGVVTELSIIGKMHNPHTSLGHIHSISKFSDMSIKDADVIVPIPRISTETPLNKISQSLLHYPSIMLETEGEVSKIITRADLLKLIAKT